MISTVTGDSFISSIWTVARPVGRGRIAALGQGIAISVICLLLAIAWRMRACWQAMEQAFLTSDPSLKLGRRLMMALQAGEAAGGDHRSQPSALQRRCR